MSSSVVASTMWFATANGLSMAQIEQATGISGADLVEPDARHPHDVVGLIWRELRALHPDRALPLEFAQAAPMSSLYTLWHGAHYAPDLRTALRFFIEFRAILSDVLEIELVESPPAFRLSHPADVIDDGAAAKTALAISARVIRDLLRLPDVLASVEFRGAPYGPASDYEDFFGVPVRFYAEHNTLWFAPSALDAPIPVAEAVLFDYANQHLQRVRERVTAVDPLVEVRSAIANNAASDEYGAEQLARKLGVSVRVLQRFLAEHGTTPSALIEEFRAAESRRLLDDRRLSVEEISSRVGYSSARAFRRAFKRATGQTPTDYRRSL